MDDPQLRTPAPADEPQDRTPLEPLPPGLTRDALIAEVARVLAVVPAGAPLVVAVSGGPDSTALAYLVCEAREDLRVVLGHVRHGLRDDHADLEVVAWHAAALGVPLEVEEVRVDARGRGPEAAARQQRYAALRRICRRVGAAFLAVGHTADDQAETVLLRLARGTGADGLAGMAPLRGSVLRPLLRIRRGDVRRFVVGEGLRTVEDPTNRDADVPRNRVRHTVLPALEGVGPDPVAALWRLAALARRDAAALDAQARRTADRLVRRFGPARLLPEAELRRLPTAVATRLLRRLVAELGHSGAPPPAARIEALLDLPTGRRTELDGVWVTVGGGWIALLPTAAETPRPAPLPVPGGVAWAPLELEVRADTPRGQLALDGWQPAVAAPPRLPPGSDPALGQVVLGLADRPAELWVRPRRPGDRVLTPRGPRKLKDLLADRHIPRAVRDLLPVVTLADRVLWVPGVAVDAEAAAQGRREPTLALAVVAVED